MNSKKNLVLRVIFTILFLATCVRIFYFSAQNGDSSGSLSRKVMRDVAQVFTDDETRINQAVETGEPILRKIAHFSVYTLLGIFAMGMMSTYFKNLDFDKAINKQIVISILLGALYATSDEIHQAFVPNRSGRVIDVVLDTIGVANGTLLVAIVLAILQKHYKKIKIKK